MQHATLLRRPGGWPQYATGGAAQAGGQGRVRNIGGGVAGWHAWLSDRRPCFAGNPAPQETKEETEKRQSLPGKPAYTPSHYMSALSPEARYQHGPRQRGLAPRLPQRVRVLDNSGDAAHRTYGCLYGVEIYGGSNPMAVEPSAVSAVSAAQKPFSALMIFLFGLALRNMLKMR